MAKKNGKKNHLTKKGAKEQIVKALESSLGDLRVALGEKKFNKRVKQATKVLTTGLPKSDKAPAIKTRKIVLENPAGSLVKPEGNSLNPA